jgi:hypothetical protein
MNSKIILLFIACFMLFGIKVNAQKSPHGEKFKTECAVCHLTKSWTKIKPDGFNHNKTSFPLKGQHNAVTCKKCHPTLVFEDKIPRECVSCHNDIHEGTVGKDCKRCHNQNDWFVKNIRQIHLQVGFALIGEHAAADCNRCHTSASLLRFNNIQTGCYSCHRNEYEMTVKPNHRTVGYSTDCQRCHNMSGQTWRSIGNGFDHGYFPLVGGHKSAQCDYCHINNDFNTKLNKNCDAAGCHDGVDKSATPAHTTKFKTFACADCHTSAISWNTVKFPIHDAYGRIYSGTHKGKWTACSDCHTNDAAYTSFCSKCHNFSTGKLN